ncbi:hypothetical protein BDK51DRAFT_32234 [Blyttiomyces helicus]|uniref:Uncharacterized protein n=1 Tax=Blyttiomyces helicus TaxID=388810 RepID=A0A4P9W1U9_9FUNG|nr:hypothetical protein BDK51DRAFT_32234 [Blyttiomyces helicus]|eukprot:RKO85662.1 hypothetical protein BDK51DRAFT_32234 [Blyttiomyces helicus]
MPKVGSSERRDGDADLGQGIEKDTPPFPPLENGCSSDFEIRFGDHRAGARVPRTVFGSLITTRAVAGADCLLALLYTDASRFVWIPVLAGLRTVCGLGLFCLMVATGINNAKKSWVKQQCNEYQSSENEPGRKLVVCSASRLPIEIESKTDIAENKIKSEVDARFRPH